MWFILLHGSTWLKCWNPLGFRTLSMQSAEQETRSEHGTIMAINWQGPELGSFGLKLQKPMEIPKSTYQFWINGWPWPISFPVGKLRQAMAKKNRLRRSLTYWNDLKWAVLKWDTWTICRTCSWSMSCHTGGIWPAKDEHFNVKNGFWWSSSSNCLDM